MANPNLGHRLTLKTLLTPLLFFLLALYIVLLGIAGWAYNKQLGTGLGGNKVTQDLITYTLLAGVIGIASVLAGFHYISKWTPESKASATATSIVALPITILALGIASKYLHVGHLKNKKLTTLAAYAIIIGVTQLLYTLLVHGFLGEDRLIGYSTPATTSSTPATTTEATKEAQPAAAAEEPAAAKPATGEAAV